MPFNSRTYRANQHRKRAWRHLDEARAIKDRVERGVAYDWEAPGIRFNVTMARLCMRLHRLTKQESP